MIFLGLIDTNGLGDFTPSLYSYLPNEERERIININNETRRKETLFSRFLLKKMYENVFKKTLPALVYNKFGKPFFENSEVDFSISHSEGIVCVAISEKGKIGVDIQAFLYTLKKRENIEKRFLKNVDFDNLNDYFITDINVWFNSINSFLANLRNVNHTIFSWS